MKTLTIAACLWLAAPVAAQTRPVHVFITSVGAQHGMTDPSKDNLDTVKDLTRSLTGKKEIVVVIQREAAEIVLVVQGRSKSDMTASAFGPGRDVVIRVQLVYKDVASEMSASAMGGTLVSGGAWKKAAGKVADQVRTWVRTNRTLFR